MPMAARDIQEIYLAYFGRPADPAGLAHWQAQSSLAQAASAFSQSAEYQSLYAANDYTQLVTNIYQNLFKRAPEESGLNYWVQQLNEGKVQPGDAALTILDGALGQDAAVLQAKLNAAEAFTATLNTDTLAAAYKGNGPAADARATWATITSAATASAAQADFPALIDKMQTHWVDGVQKMYVAYFGRPADSTGLNYWVEQAIATKGDWLSMAEDFAKSPESQKLYGASSNAALVNAIYLNVLGRAAEPAGSQYWVDQLAKGATTPGALAITLANNALGKDATTLGQRIDASKAFTLQLETAGRNDDFTGATVTSAAREWLYGIGPEQNDYDAAIAAIPTLVNAFVKGQVQGLLVNGYIAGATVFIDADGDGVLDAGEVSVKSDAAGNFLFPEGTATGTVVAFGGTSISTGQPNTTTLKAPVGATVVTPLTNLVQQMIDSGLADGIDAAENLLFGALGIPKVDLSAFDPLKTALSGSAAEKAIAIQIEAATVQIANTLATGSALLQGAGLTAAQAQAAMLGALTQTIAGGTGVNLGQASTVQTVLEQAVSGSGLTPAQQTQARNAMGATSQVLGEINARTEQAADAFSAGTGTNPISALSDIFKLATLVQTQVTGAVQQGTSSGNTTTLTTQYTGTGLTESVDQVEGGQINPDTPTDDGTEVTNGGGNGDGGGGGGGGADTTAPTVSSVAITSATGVQNSTLNAGDVLSVTVTMSEATTVNTTNGTPQLALSIGGTTVQAQYASGSGSTALVFNFTVLAGQTDANGIAIAADSLALNGGTLRDAAGNNATLTHAAVADNAGYLVDTTAPFITSGSFAGESGPSTITLTFNEAMKVSDATGVVLQRESYPIPIPIPISVASITADINAPTTVNIGLVDAQLYGSEFVKFTFDKATGNIADLAGNKPDLPTFYIGGSGNNNMSANSESTGVRMEGNAGDDDLYGSAHADTIIGGAGNDYITAGAGNDTIIGGAGADRLKGGTGADTFVFKAGDSGVVSGSIFDTILDYTAGAGGDVLYLGDAVVAANASSVDVTDAVAGSGASNVTATILDGVITLAGLNSGTFLSLDQWLAVARLVVTADTHVAAFQFDSYTGVFTSDAYVFQKNDGGDLLIKLDGVTGIAAVSKNPDGTVALTTQPPANAAPVLATPTAISFTDTAADDTFTEATGTLSATDTDTGDTITYGIDGGTLDVQTGTVSKAGTYGTLVVNTTDGTYTFTPNDAAIEGLKTPQSETFTVTATDGKVTTPVSQTLTINVTGVNDTATITGTSTGAVTKNADTDPDASGVQTVATGTLSVSDRDSADTGFQAVTNAAASMGGYGTYTVTTGGQWAYTLDNANATVQALVASATPLTDTFKVLSADGTEQVVSVTIQGAGADGDTTAPFITSGSFTEGVGPSTIILTFNEAMKVAGAAGVVLQREDGVDTISVASITADINAPTKVNIKLEDAQLYGFESVKFTFDKATGNVRDLAGNKTDSLTFYIGGSDNNFMDANGEGTGVRMEGNAGADELYGSAHADTIIGGLGFDEMAGGEDADIFVFAPGSGSDFIQDWNHAGTPDVIAFAGGELAVVTHATASAGLAAINSNGIATFEAADSTQADRITAVEAAINAGGDAAAGQFAVFEYGSSSFVFISDGIDGVTTNDVLIELVGITGLATSRIIDGVVTLTEPPP